MKNSAEATREATSRFHFYAGAFVFGLLSGCLGSPSHHDPSWTRVSMTDFSVVAGEWEGTIKKGHNVIPEGSVRLIIRESGSYMFVGQNNTRVAVGTGSLEVRDGRLADDTERRAVILTLYERKGQHILAVDATNRETGDRLSGDFTRVQ